MLFRNTILSILVGIAGIMNISNVYAQKVFYDNLDTFENMLRSADLIILGTVVNTRIAEEPYRNLTIVARYSEFIVEEIISKKLNYTEKRIEIKTIDAMIENGKNTMAYIPKKPQEGNRYIALIKKRNDGFCLIYDSSGLIPIIGDKIQNTDINVFPYAQNIRAFISSTEKEFNGYKQPIYPDLNPNSIRAEKVSVIEDWNNAIRSISGKYFRAYVSDPTTSPCSVIFHINPSGAQGGNGETLYFDDIYPVAAWACSVWNAISGANISLSVDDEEYAGYRVGNDGISTITFESMEYWGLCAEGDVKINTDVHWNLPGQSGGVESLKWILAHEIGHMTGIDDLGESLGCDPDIYPGINYNLMWHEGTGRIAGIDSPQDGDKAGAIFCRPKFSTSPGVDAIYYIGVMSNITNDITISSGKRLEIDGYGTSSTAAFASGVKINVYGTLDLNSANLTRSGGSNWSGIDIYNGGTVNILTDDCSIEYADTGIDISNATGLSNGENKLTIKNCSQAGIGVNNCSPTIHKVYLENVSNSTYQNGGITVTGSSASPTINHCTVKGNSGTSGTFYGILVGTSSTGTDVADSDIQNSVYSHSIQINSSCLINLNEAAPGNNIVRRNTDVKAINNPSTGAIDARYNWWGVNPPTDALFSFPANVDYTLYQTSSVAGSGASKPVVFEPHDNLARARQYEADGNYPEALRLYNEILAEEKNPYKRKYVVSAMLRCTDKYDRDYSGLRAVLAKELADTTFSYRAPLDFIESDILVREGKYREAVDSFRSKLDKYRGTYMEVEMLGRIAQMYGSYLDNKAEAKVYADRAAAVNPGQETLRFAYDAAGIDYNPAAHENRFALDDAGSFQQPEPKPLEQGTQEFVSVSPNPANPLTSITYSIKNPSTVKLTIYSINGQKVATLVDGPMSAGAHSVKFDGSRYASGVYFYRFESAGLKKTGKMLLLK
jgi:hypothetical protein